MYFIKRTNGIVLRPTRFFGITSLLLVIFLLFLTLPQKASAGILDFSAKAFNFIKYTIEGGQRIKEIREGVIAPEVEKQLKSTGRWDDMQALLEEFPDSTAQKDIRGLYISLNETSNKNSLFRDKFLNSAVELDVAAYGTVSTVGVSDNLPISLENATKLPLKVRVAMGIKDMVGAVKTLFGIDNDFAENNNTQKQPPVALNQQDQLRQIEETKKKQAEEEKKRPETEQQKQKDQRKKILPLPHPLPQPPRSGKTQSGGAIPGQEKLVRVFGDVWLYNNAQDTPPLGIITGCGSNCSNPTAWRTSNKKPDIHEQPDLQRGESGKYLSESSKIANSLEKFPQSTRAIKVELPNGKTGWIVAEWVYKGKSMVLAETISSADVQKPLSAEPFFPDIEGKWRGSWIYGDTKGDFEINIEGGWWLYAQGSETTQSGIESFTISGSLFGNQIFFYKNYSSRTIYYEGEVSGNVASGTWQENSWFGSSGKWSMTKTN